MKKLIFTLMFALPTFYFAQEEKPKESPTTKECDLPKDFKEPIKIID